MVLDKDSDVAVEVVNLLLLIHQWGFSMSLVSLYHLSCPHNIEECYFSRSKYMNKVNWSISRGLNSGMEFLIESPTNSFLAWNLWAGYMVDEIVIINPHPRPLFFPCLLLWMIWGLLHYSLHNGVVIMSLSATVQGHWGWPGRGWVWLHLSSCFCFTQRPFICSWQLSL